MISMMNRLIQILPVLMFLVVLCSSQPVSCEEKGSVKTVVYYFHHTIRCPSCNLIESLTKIAIELGFEKELQAGDLEFRPVNVDDDETTHFVEDYSLSSQSVILSRVVDGREEAWKNLVKVWDFLHQETEFIDYIQEQTRSFLKEF
ncbi:MAG: nitrophenyl compound nitroreductase subunit ArsF family protein [Pseudomonadota bacterium]